MSDQLLDLALRDPGAAEIAALRVIRGDSDAEAVSRAHRARAVVQRDRGEHDAALNSLVAALEVAENAGPAVVADVRATYGATLVVVGQPMRGISELGRAIADLEGIELSTALYRRGVCLTMLGRFKEAAIDLERAVALMKLEAPGAWFVQAVGALTEVYQSLGRLRDAERLLEADTTTLTDPADVVIRKGTIAYLRQLGGDVASALSILNSIDATTLVDERRRGVLAVQKSGLYLSVGLVEESRQALLLASPDRMSDLDAATWLGMVARVDLIQGDYAVAASAAREASRQLRQLGSEWHALDLDLVELQARVGAGKCNATGRRSALIAQKMEANGSRRAVDAWVLAGDYGGAESASYYASAARYRHDEDRLIAATGWLALGRERQFGRRRGVASACGYGLNALDEYRETMGSSELRAMMTHRGRQLAELALAHVARDPRTLLTWSERWRATSLAQPPVTPHGEVSPALAMLRDSGRRIAEAREAGDSTVALEQERRRLERRVRAEHHQQRSEGTSTITKFDPAELVAEVGDGAFIELVDVDGVLHVLVVSRGRVRRVIASETKATLELADAGRFALRRSARTNRYAPGDLGQRFQDAVLGKAVRMFPDGPVTISPTAALHGAPFALMPALANRPFSLVPSAAQWMRALAVPTPRTRRRALISGPNLLTGGAEVGRLAAEYPDATILRGTDATVEATMKAIDGAKLAHLATHGTFRADSPLFSALEMADGQLSVYELERLNRAPYRTILSACDSGVLAPVGAQEVLGLASALFSLGSAGLVCSIAEVNDEATADLMMRVHASLDAKRTPAEALAEVRAEGSPVEQATAAAFVALGV